MVYLWIVVLVLFGLAFLLMEIFIPSFGLLSVAGAAALTISLVLAFRENVMLGVFVAAAIAVLLPLVLKIGIKVFPDTPIGRWVVLKPFQRRKEDRASGDESINGLVGAEGVTITRLRPAGVAEFDGRRLDVVTEGVMVDVNRPVKIVRVEGNRIVVRERGE